MGSHGLVISFPLDTANFSQARLTNASNITSTEGNIANNPVLVNYVIGTIIYTVSCPFTALLNVLMIMAVKRRPRPSTNSNLLLACFLGQPSYILRRLFLLFDLRSSVIVQNVHCTFIAVLIMASSLYLILVAFESLMAIKFTLCHQDV